MKTLQGIVASSMAAMLLPIAGTAIGADSETEAIRQEIKQMRDDYESRIRALEERLKAAEDNAAQAQSGAISAQPRDDQAPAPAPATRTGQNAFNPDISLILSGFYRNLSRDPDTYRIAGFIPGGEGIGPGSRGFSLSESELSVSASVDHLFYGNLTTAITGENEIEVEEAYFKTLALPAGLSLKGGRFFSGVGYLNEVHAHAWDFVDQPLAYRAFLGGQYRQNGLQLKWIAPTPMFLELGVEGGNGESFPGAARNKNGVNGGAGFVHIGDDIGDSISWRAGLSYLYHRPQHREFEDASGNLGDAVHAFSGKSKLAILDFTMKWAPRGNATDTSLKLQGEYFHSREDGDLTSEFAGDGTLAPVSVAGRYRARQSGFYVQGVYQFLHDWRLGLRYDQLDSGTTRIGAIGTTDDSGAFTFTRADFGLLDSFKPKRASVMLDWNPSEFSRIRLQYAQDKARRDETDNQFFIQYIYSLGAHGAHRF
jgi:hypothetical protein